LASSSAIASSLALTVVVVVVGLLMTTILPPRTDIVRSFLRLVEKFFDPGVGRRRG
jgi:hypothetical protein